MTTTAVDSVSAPPGGARAPLPRRRRVPVHVGQVVATQVALALPAAALVGDGGPLALAGAVAGGLALLAMTWVRVRRRWLYQWLGLTTRFRGRARTLPPGAGPRDLLRLVAPGTTVDDDGVVDGLPGLTALLELTDPGGVRGDPPHPLPSPAALLPPDSPDLPLARIQLVLTAAPAPAARLGGAPPATSYRQLTNGLLAGHERAVLAVTVLRADGWTDTDLRRALAGVARRVTRRLAPLRVRPLAGDAALAVLTELSHHDGAQPVREHWAAVQLGGLVQATFRLRRWPDLGTETARRLVPRLLGLPASAVTVAIGAGPRAGDAVAADLAVRLAAVSPAHLSAAVKAMHRLLSAEGAAGWRLDGEQLPGVAATLPLGAGPRRLPGRRGDPPMPAATLDLLDLPHGGAGLMLGANRRGEPVIAALFRPESTRAVLVGGLRAAQLVAFRAMALGARVVVQTARPGAWEPFVRGASSPGDVVALVPPGRAAGGPAPDPLRPLLVVVDVGPVAADRTPGPAWSASLVVRDDLSPADVDAVGSADVVVLQPLRPDEAALAADALGLGDAAQWLTRIRDDMVGVVSRRTVRWALMSPTPIEAQFIGSPTR